MRNKLIVIAAILLICSVALFVYADARQNKLAEEIAAAEAQIALLDADTHAAKAQQQAEYEQLLLLEQQYSVQKERYDAIQLYYQQFREATAE